MKTIVHHFILTLVLLSGLASPGYADASSSAQNCDIATRKVNLDGGVLYYNQAGTGAHVLLLHGVFAQKEQWNDVLCLLSAAGYAVIAPDLPGYGQSTGFPLADYRLENQVQHLRQFMDALHIARFDLAGSSMGGAIAALYVRQHRRQVRTLAFIGSPFGIVDWGLQFKEAIYEGINPLIPIDLAQFDLEMSLLFFKPPTIPESIKAAVVKDYLERNRHYQQVWDIVNLYDSVLEDGPAIQNPTLTPVGHGGRDFPRQRRGPAPVPVPSRQAGQIT